MYNKEDMLDYYFKVLGLVEDAKYKATSCILYEYKLYNLAVFLKTKFKDKRSVRQLVDLIISEYDLTHKTPSFLTRNFL